MPSHRSRSRDGIVRRALLEARHGIARRLQAEGDDMSPVSDGNGRLIDCRSVWKVFGKKSDAAIRAIAERGLGKTEVLKEFGSVVGVANVSLALNKGEIFCIMGLSGSGKSTLIRLFNRLIEPSLGKIFVRGIDIAAM